VTIDWDGFLAAGGRDEMQRLHESAAVERMHRARPEQSAKQREDAKVALETWVAAVQAGSLKRKQFDQSVDTHVKLGLLDPSEAEAARRTLDG
jgi:ribosomal protein L1